MRTDESVIKEVKSNRKKLFYKLYFIPWILLTVCLFVSIFYLWFENERLQEVNFRLVKKIQAQQIIVSWPQNYKNEVTDKNDEIEEESKESEESNDRQGFNSMCFCNSFFITSRSDTL